MELTCNNFLFQGSLPISVIFEMDPESGRLNPNDLNELMNVLDVHIMVKKKTNQNICSIMIRGYERNGSKFCWLNLRDAILFRQT